MNLYKKHPIALLKRLRHGIEWRMKYRVMPFLALVLPLPWAWLCVKGRWFMQRKERPHKLPAKLVVSLTSYPPRFGTLALTLRCLLRQTVKADHTILWVSYSDFNLLPPDVLVLQNKGLEIRKTDDLRSYKKIIPALDAFPDAFICTADDDLYYRADWLEELLDGASIKDRVVTCHRAYEMRTDEQGRFVPYKEWTISPPPGRKTDNLCPTGVGGVLYPPGSLTHTPEDRQAFLELCPHADDIWLYWMGRRNETTYKTTSRWFHIINWRGSQEKALWRHNVIENGNDIQIQRMAEKYGYPKTKDLGEVK